MRLGGFNAHCLLPVVVTVVLVVLHNTQSPGTKTYIRGHKAEKMICTRSPVSMTSVVGGPFSGDTALLHTVMAVSPTRDQIISQE